MNALFVPRTPTSWSREVIPLSRRDLGRARVSGKKKARTIWQRCERLTLLNLETGNVRPNATRESHLYDRSVWLWPKPVACFPSFLGALLRVGLRGRVMIVGDGEGFSLFPRASQIFSLLFFFIPGQ